MFRTLNISASGLTAERLRMDTISSNIANSDTTRTADGGPYRRKIALFEEHLRREMDDITGRRRLRSAGVKAVGIVDSGEEMPLIYDPVHPDAGPDGYVVMPNVNMATELIDLMVSRRSYEANVTAFNANKSILLKTLEIGR